jgi:hypothetical protein
MTNRRVLIGLGVTLLVLWSAAPVLAGGQSSPTGWSQMSSRYAAEPEWALGTYGCDEDAYFDALESMPWQGVRHAAMEEQEGTDMEGIAGRVHDFITSYIAGEPTLHVLAKIDTPRGTATVDLGPVGQVPPTQPGEFIRLRGFWTQVNNRNVFVTTWFNNGQRNVRIFVGPQRQAVRHIQGEVLGTYTITSDQTGNGLRVARIRTDDGRMRLMNLGSPSDTASLDLQRGDEITAVGRPVGLLRFRAYEVSANGQTVPIDWSAVVRNWAAQRYQQAGFMEQP